MSIDPFRVNDEESFAVRQRVELAQPLHRGGLASTAVQRHHQRRRIGQLIRRVQQVLAVEAIDDQLLFHVPFC